MRLFRLLKLRPNPLLIFLIGRVGGCKQSISTAQRLAHLLNQLFAAVVWRSSDGAVNGVILVSSQRNSVRTFFTGIECGLLRISRGRVGTGF